MGSPRLFPLHKDWLSIDYVTGLISLLRWGSSGTIKLLQVSLYHNVLSMHKASLPHISHTLTIYKVYIIWAGTVSLFLVCWLTFTTWGTFTGILVITIVTRGPITTVVVRAVVIVHLTMDAMETWKIGHGLVKVGYWYIIDILLDFHVQNSKHIQDQSLFKDTRFHRSTNTKSMHGHEITIITQKISILKNI